MVRRTPQVNAQHGKLPASPPPSPNPLPTPRDPSHPKLVAEARDKQDPGVLPKPQAADSEE